MKKSELKSIIREMIQEELSKMNEAATLQESTETEVVTEDVETITEEVITEEMPAAEAVKEESAEDVAEEAVVEEQVEEPAAEESTEVVEEAVDSNRTSIGVVRDKSYQDIASDIYNSDEFRGAFAIDGSVYGDEVNLVIEDALMSTYPTLSDEKFANAVTSITKHLSEFVAGEDEVADADFYSDNAFDDLDRIYRDHFDAEGNAY